MIGNPDITWERSRKYDAGLETKFFNNRLSADFDYFYEKRDNILTTLGTIPSIYGVPSSAVPPANVGITQNQGYELVLSWSDKIGDLNYTIGGDLSWTRNKIIYKAEANNPYEWMNATGHAIGQRFGLVSDGLFNTQEELANRPYNTYTSNQATLGDIRYKDLDGDGLINQNDIAPIGFPNYAQYHFNVKVQLAYKGFDLRLLFTGSANGSYYLNSGYTMPFFKNAGNAWLWQYEGRWTPEKYAAGETITYPRATYSPTTSHNNYLQSDYWMVSTNHFKLKNVELGYTFNVKLQLAYKGFDLRLLFTGSANGSYYLNSGYTMPFFKNAGNAWLWQYEGRWTPEKYAAGETITYPRATYSPTTSHNNYLQSDYWMVSTNHFKLKNIELGYTFNVKKGVLSQLQVQSLRVFMTANNVYTFKNALTPYGIDPETTDGSAYVYPLTKVITFGLNMRF